jgi:PAS domain S-box-containing protein
MSPNASGTGATGPIDIHAGPLPSGDIAQLTLDHRGTICDCNRAAESLFRYAQGTLAGRHVAELLPQLAGSAIVKDGRLNADLRYLCRIGRPFQAVDQHGQRFAAQLFLTALDGAAQNRVSLVVRPLDQTSEDWPPARVN